MWVSLELGGWVKIEELVKSHEGKVVVVDVWSNYCDPCKWEFPNLVDIHNTMEGLRRSVLRFFNFCVTFSVRIRLLGCDREKITTVAVSIPEVIQTG